MKRREFIKLSGTLGLGSALPLLSGCAERPLPGTGKVASTPTVCEICFWKCAGHVYRENGEAWKIVGNESDLHSGGRMCTRGSGGMGAYLDPDRLKRPLIRDQKGDRQEFREASWEEALDYVAKRLRAIAETHGPEHVALFRHGAAGHHLHHVLRAYGTDNEAEPAFAQCRGPRDVGFKLTFGETLSSPERTDMAHTDCLVLIGSHIGENLHNGQVQTFAEAIRRGATIITVDPRFSTAAGKSKYWLPIKPGTDIALLLAWMHVIISEEIYDKDYIQLHAIGFEQLSAHVKTATPEWAYLETGLEPDLIRKTAREMARCKPATLVHPGRHATWYGDDTQRSRAIAILNALLGSWGRKGGLYIPEAVRLPHYPLPAYPKVNNEATLELRKKYPFAQHGVTQELIERSIGEDAYFRGWVVCGTNLAISIPGTSEKIRQAAESLELFVAIDTMPAEITGYADVVLPECTYLERYDRLRNSGERHPSVALRMPAFEPLYDSKPAWWIARELGLRLGLGDYFPWKDYSEVLDWQLQEVGSSLEEMQRLGVKNFPRKSSLYFREGQPRRFRTPSRKIELYSQQMADKGLDPMPRYTPPDEAPEDHYRLIYGRAPAHTFGRTTNNPLLYQLMPENVVWVNPLVAHEWKIRNGDYVKLRNQDGVESNRVRVRVTERIRPDSVFMAHGFGHTDRRQRLTYNVGASDSRLITRVKIDPAMGGTGMRSNFVTFIKA